MFDSEYLIRAKLRVGSRPLSSSSLFTNQISWDSLVSKFQLSVFRAGVGEHSWVRTPWSEKEEESRYLSRRSSEYPGRQSNRSLWIGPKSDRHMNISRISFSYWSVACQYSTGSFNLMQKRKELGENQYLCRESGRACSRFERKNVITYRQGEKREGREPLPPLDLWGARPHPG